MHERKHRASIGLDGALFVLAPLLLLLPFSGNGVAQPETWQLILAASATIMGMMCALLLARRPLIGGWLGSATTILGFVAFLPGITENPFAALSAAIGLIFILSTLYDYRATYRTGTLRCYAAYLPQRTRWAVLAVPAAVVVRHFLDIEEEMLGICVVAGAAFLAQLLFVWWAVRERSLVGILLSTVGLAAIGYSLWIWSGIHVTSTALVLSAINLAILPRHKSRIPGDEHWWESLLNHPARILFTTFFSLCAIGTILLSLPLATKTGVIEMVDAVFTAVSAVCVTGLIVLDTAMTSRCLDKAVSCYSSSWAVWES